MPLDIVANDDLFKAANFSLASACPMKDLVTTRSAQPQQTGQILLGENILAKNRP